MRDVIIIGAGPAGTATAARLHQHGIRDVLILERRTLPRDKPCGGGLTGPVEEALAAVDLALTVPHVPSTQARVRFGGFERAVRLERPVRMIRRIEFDQSLVDQVRARGVEVLEGETVRALSVEQEGVTLLTAGGHSWRARVVVGADGAASVVRRHLQRGTRALPHRLFMQEIESTRPQECMLYDFSPMATGMRGYLWIFPVHGNRLNVGVMQHPAQRRDGAQLMDDLRAGLQPHGLALPAQGAQGWPAWAYDSRAAVAAPRLLLAGDAAGIDALTGEGISVALEQARLAGDAIARALRISDLSFRDFSHELRRASVGRDLARQTLFARLLYQADHGWRNWLSLLLFDHDVLNVYTEKVAGTKPLSQQSLRLLRALARHAVLRASRERRLLARA